MVAYESLLQRLNPPSAVKHVKLEDSCIVPIASQGQTCLGPATLDKVLLVLDLTFNLFAVNKMPDHLSWSFFGQDSQINWSHNANHVTL